MMGDLLIDGKLLHVFLVAILGQGPIEAFADWYRTYSGASAVFLCDYNPKWDDKLGSIIGHIWTLAISVSIPLLPVGIFAGALWKFGHRKVATVELSVVKVVLKIGLFFTTITVGFFILFNTFMVLDHYNATVSCTEAVQFYEAQKDYRWKIVE